MENNPSDIGRHRDTPGRILIIGIGNSLRRDDGLGEVAVDMLRAHPRCAEWGVDVISVHQLMPELAEQVSRAGLVVLIDAACDVPPGEVRVARVEPKATDETSFSHGFDAPAMLWCSQTLYGRLPEAWLVSVGGEDFDVGMGLSDTVTAAMTGAVQSVLALILGAGERN